MKRFLICFLGGLIAVSSCSSKEVSQEEKMLLAQNSNTSKNETKVSDSVMAKKFLDVQLVGIKKNYFIRDELENILRLKKLGYEGIDYLKIRIKNYSKPLKGMVYYGALQYTISDNPAYPLEASFQEPVILHQDKKGDYNISDILKTTQQIEHLINTKYYDLFFQESLKAQSEFYMRIADDKRFLECCPEYIEQGKKFLGKRKNDFKSLSDLSLWPTYKKIVLDIGKDRKFVFINYE